MAVSRARSLWFFDIWDWCLCAATPAISRSAQSTSGNAFAHNPCKQKCDKEATSRSRSRSPRKLELRFINLAVEILHAALYDSKDLFRDIVMDFCDVSGYAEQCDVNLSIAERSWPGDCELSVVLSEANAVPVISSDVLDVLVSKLTRPRSPNHIDICYGCDHVRRLQNASAIFTWSGVHVRVREACV